MDKVKSKIGSTAGLLNIQIKNDYNYSGLFIMEQRCKNNLEMTL